MVERAEILIVDQDRRQREWLAKVLEGHGYRVRRADSREQALARLSDKRPDLLITEVSLETETAGFDLIVDLQGKPLFSDLPSIFVTDFLEKVKDEGPEKYQHMLGEPWPVRWLFEKPVDTDLLLDKLIGILAES